MSVVGARRDGAGLEVVLLARSRATLTRAHIVVDPRNQRTTPDFLPLQIAKLLIIPFVCLIERFYMGRTFSNEVLATIGLVVVGVAVV